MIFRFEDFRFNTDSRELYHGDEEREVEPQVLALLELLLTNSDRMISKDEIVEEVWDNRIVSDGSINSRIKLLRKALNDDGKQQRLIKTIHGQGFRFVGELQDILEKQPHSIALEMTRSDALQTTQQEKQKETSIAILAFDNMSNDPEQEYFADGMCEDIITVLSKLPRLRVVARNSAFVYKGKSSDIREIGKNLGVDYVLEGSVRRLAHRIRVTAQLINTETGLHVWAERYDREVEDIFKLQDEMTREIVSAMQINLTEGLRGTDWTTGTKIFAAWEKMVQAYPLIHSWEKEKLTRGRKLALEAIELDSTYAQPRAALGISFVESAYCGWDKSIEDAFQESAKNCQLAWEMAPDNPIAIYGMSFVKLAMGDFDEAYAMAKQAYELAPYLTDVACGFSVVSFYAGRLDGIEQIMTEAISAFRINPAHHYMVFACYYLLSENPEKAIEYAGKSQAISAKFPMGYLFGAIGHAKTGDWEKAKWSIGKYLKLCPNFNIDLFRMTNNFKDRSIQDDWATILVNAGVPEY